MDHTLRCNSLNCRVSLNDQAVVTTCNHIFCIPCSESLGLANPHGERLCPCCQSYLPNPDDAVSTDLNPTEDYKTSVLSGFSPSVIMECAGRGLSFWTYQATQEMVYQEHLAKSWTEKYSNLSGQMNNVIHDANAEITNLRCRISTLQVDHEGLQKKYHELGAAYREKSRKHSQTQELYDKLKKRALLGKAQLAASDKVDETLRNASFSNEMFSHPRDGAGKAVPDKRQQDSPQRRSDSRERGQRASGQSWEILSDQISGNLTPSQHRQRLPLNGPTSRLEGQVGSFSPILGQHQTNARQDSARTRLPLSDRNTNSGPRFMTPIYNMDNRGKHHRPPGLGSLPMDTRIFKPLRGGNAYTQS